MNIGHLRAVLTVDTRQFTSGLQTANKQLAAAGKRMQVVGQSISMYLSLPMALAAGAAVKMSSDFEASMSKITGLVGVAKSEVDAMKGSVLSLSGATAQAPTELADALFFVTSAGIKGAEAMDVLEMSAKAAAAGLGETEVVADLVTSAMNAYGSSVLSAEQATNILVATVREGKAPADALAGAMGQVLPIASQMGVSFDQVGAAVAAMTRTGTEATTASMQLKNILNAILKPTQQAEDAMAQMGTSSAILRKQLREKGLISVLGFLREQMKTNEQAMAQVFPNIRALSGALDLMGANAEDNIAIFERMKDTTGALEDAFESASGTMKFKFNAAMAEMKAGMVKMGDAFIPVALSIAKGLKSMAQWFTNLSGTTKKVIAAITTMTVVAGPLLMIFGAMATAIAAVSAPLLAVVGGIAALTGGMILLSNRTEKTSDKLLTHKTRLNALASALIKYNDNADMRGRIIKEIQKKYPGFLKNLDTEKLTTKQITDRLREYNEQLDEKVKKQVFEEDYIKLKKKELELQRKELELITKREALEAKKPFQDTYMGIGAVDGQLSKVNAQLTSMSMELEENSNAMQKLKKEAEGLGIEFDKLFSESGSGGNGGKSGIVKERVKVILDGIKSILNFGNFKGMQVPALPKALQKVPEALKMTQQQVGYILDNSSTMWSNWKDRVTNVMALANQGLTSKFDAMVSIVADGQQRLQMLSQAITGILTTLAVSIGQSLGGAPDNFATPLQRILLILADFVSQFGKMMIGLGTAMALMPGMFGMGAAIAAAGFALTLLGSAASAAINASIEKKREEAGRKPTLTRDVQGLATGGFVIRGGVFQLHKNELVTLPAGAAVTPATQTRQVMGGGSLTSKISMRELIIQIERERTRMRR